MINPSGFRKLNNYSGWFVFAIAAIVYFICVEPTASFWDCGEYIACSYGIETGHPPGAPFFLIIAKVFSLFSFGNNELVAPLINIMSATASAFTILFLFWSITHLARKVLLKTEEDFASEKKWLVLGAGAIGALSYAFTDSFWFSAEEGEVYALSSFFTAVVFWAMLKWEDVYGEAHADRWLVFIAYMIGLSIGVHLLNLLAIPAIVFIWFFRRYGSMNLMRFVIACIVSVLLLGGIQDVLIPGIVSLAGKTELLFVNTFGFGFNSGIIAFFVLLTVLIFGGLFLSRRFKIYWLNTALLCFSVLLIGYSSFLVLVIRSQAITPINEGNPSNPVSLLSYLNREQYGDWPLVYGQYYNSPLDKEEPYLDGKPIYVKDEKSGRYIISDARKQSIPNYDPRGCVFFPRMYSSGHARGYESWAKIKGERVVFADKNGKADTVKLPTFGENLQYFFVYQCGWMYGRYFFWNFVGRQNDRLGYGNDAEGNFLWGIPAIDDARLGNHKLMPEAQKKNKARNTYFAIPLILGFLGFLWQIKHAQRDSLVVILLFVFTGLVIIFYLNQTPWQPRERDYAYVGSFYAFSIWIGLGLIYVHSLIRNLMKPVVAVGVAMFFSSLSPVLLFAQNFDDHNRSGRTAASDLAINMLESCEQNAILFTYADNDTFPLWYAQEVLGIRRDVRIICLSLLRSDWYIDQAKRKQYTSDALPISMNHWQYRDGTRDYVYFDEPEDTIDIAETVRYFSSEDPSEKYVTVYGDSINLIPSRNISMDVDKKTVLENFKGYGYSDSTLPSEIIWRMRGNYLMKDQLVILDILANNHWKRPIYFAVNMPVTSYTGLDEYLQLEGLALRFVPQKNDREAGNLQLRPAVHLDKAYNKLMNAGWGGLRNPSVYADETVARMFASPMLTASAQTATALAEAGRHEEALRLILKATSEIPELQIAPDANWQEMISAAYLCEAGKENKSVATNLSRKVFEHALSSVRWYETQILQSPDLSEQKNALNNVIQLAEENGNTALANEFRQRMKAVGLATPPPPVDEKEMQRWLDSIARDSLLQDSAK